MVKLSVKVKLVEPTVNNHVGRVIVENVTSQYSIMGTSQIRSEISLHRNVTSEADCISCSLLIASAETCAADEAVACLREELKMLEPVAVLCASGGGRLDATMAYPSASWLHCGGPYERFVIFGRG